MTKALSNKSKIRTFVRGLISIGSFSLIVYVLFLSQKVELIWYLTVLATIPFMVMCYFFPKRMVDLQSMPYVFPLRKNIGPESLKFQSVIYAPYHVKWFSQATHSFFWLDSIAWCAVCYFFFGYFGVAVLLGLLALQVFSFGDRVLGAWMISAWFSFAIIAVSLNALLGKENTLLLSQYFLVASGFWKFVGHWPDAAPPHLVGNKGFKTLKFKEYFDRRLIPPFILGYFSEFVTGMPWRTCQTWTHMMLEYSGVHTSDVFTWREARSTVSAIQKQGWASSEVTQPLYADPVYEAHTISE